MPVELLGGLVAFGLLSTALLGCGEEAGSDVPEDVSGTGCKTKADCTALSSCHVATCGEDGVCVESIQDGFCLIDDQCIPGGQSDPADQCKVCNPEQQTTQYSAVVCSAAGQECDSGWGCVWPDDECHSDADCNMELVVDEKEICGAMKCVNGQCVLGAFEGVACDDSDQCTVDDKCVDGGCVGTALDCNDDNPCTDDVCVSYGVCEHNPLQLHPADEPVSCDDGLECTTEDICNASGECAGVPDHTVCSDGEFCNGEEQCVPDEKDADKRGCVAGAKQVAPDC